MHLAYETDTRGRAGHYVPAASPLPTPAEPVQSCAFSTEQRADGLHIVDAAGHSWGIASTPEIAAAQVSAMGRIAQ